MSRAKKEAAPLAIEDIVVAVGQGRMSYFEMTYPQFDDKTVANAAGAGQLMRQLNHTFSVCNGLSVVARIIAGNDVVRDFHDPDDPDSAAPLSESAINALNTMTAALLERLVDDISRSTEEFNDRSPA